MIQIKPDLLEAGDEIRLERQQIKNGMQGYHKSLDFSSNVLKAAQEVYMLRHIDFCMWRNLSATILINSHSLMILTDFFFG